MPSAVGIVKMSNVVVLDRVRSVRTMCMSCGCSVWLTEETPDAIRDGALPICLECARATIPNTFVRHVTENALTREPTD